MLMGKIEGEVRVYEDNVVTLIAAPEDEAAALAVCRATRSVLKAMREACPEQDGCGARITDTSKAVIDELGVMSVGFTCANVETCNRLRPVETWPPTYSGTTQS
jgi:hypothetical protein